MPAYLLRAIDDLGGGLQGTVTRLVVAHGSTCPQLQGGECNCQPSVTAVLEDDRLAEVDGNGAMVPRRPS